MFKNFTAPRVARWLVVMAALMLSACSSIEQDLFKMAMEYEREQAGLELRMLDVNGKSIAMLANEKGEKPTVVLLHGFAANKENWVRFAGHLTDGFHVVAVDLPGHGASVKNPALSYDIDDQVGYLHEILAQLKLQQFHLAGNSMGGAISSLYAATYPGQVLSLALFNPAGVYKYESELQKRLKQGKNPLIVRTEEDFDRLLDFALEEQPFIPWPIKGVLAQRAIARQDINERIFADIISDSHDYVFKTALTKIEAPALILWGKQDRVLNYANAEVFDQLIPVSKTHIWDGVGHAPMIEIPEKSAALYRDFVVSL